MVPAQSPSLINGVTIDPQTVLIYWGPFQAGDEGEPVQVYAYQRFAWQFTGFSNNDLSAPIVPVMADRTVTLLGSNDGHCYGGPIFTMHADPAGMVAKTGDPLRVDANDGAWMMIKPVVGGSINPAGPDCGLLLYCAKFFGPRP